MSSANPIKIEKVFALVAPDLAEVKRLLAKHFSSNVHIVDQVSRYVGSNTGKMLRPALMSLSAAMFGPVPPLVHRMAAVIELLHTATLVHDDIIDGAETRRGRPSVNAAYGSEISVLMGDWLYLTAFQTVLIERNFQLLDILIDVNRRMVEGELIQLDFLGKDSITTEESLDIATRKTAHLFAACTSMGGVCCLRPAEEVEQLKQIGLDLGRAFQLVDDVLDFTAEESTMGKPIMSDLREGKVTLPVIDLLQQGCDGHRRLVAGVLNTGEFPPGGVEQLKAALLETGAISRTMDLARRFIENTHRQLAFFPASPHRDGIVTVSDFILTRRK